KKMMVKMVICIARTSHEPIFIVEAASSMMVSKEIFFDRVARTHSSVVRSRASSACRERGREKKREKEREREKKREGKEREEKRRREREKRERGERERERERERE